ncbi:hypothetical protein B0A50_00549 [Salinomyces thailandicus]|uniref:Pre-mRNA polyadenylation factor Fip1 domain-containing protein n=1 Tax=Salinomyces thailandicus TaxID=706561 RepID=A0A4U0UDX6_9PEZI|nr:hypothetical protein B0A50_00549 [Salinomyces thailandica]
MEEDDDDFYGGGAGQAQVEGRDLASADADGVPEVKVEHMDIGGDGEEEADDDEDVRIRVTPPDSRHAKAERSRPSVRPTPSQDKTATIKSTTARSPTPSIKQDRSNSAAPAQQPQAQPKGSLTYAGKEGKDFPETRTSHLELHTIPQWPASNGPPKLLTDLDIDADLVEHSKPWRLPGTDQTDFFNYGFDEYTWTQYCLKQQSMGSDIGEMKAMDAQMKAMFGGGGGGGGGAGPPGMPGMPGMGGGGGGGGSGGAPPGMPGPEQMMQMMMQSGQDPSTMDFGQLMGMMGGGGPQGNGSPMPGAGQGFQQPTGPGGMEGYSAQQMALMGEQQQGGGGGGGGRGGRRGRGRW